MINMHVYYEFENESSIRRHCYKSVFEKRIGIDDLDDLTYYEPIPEAYIEIASKFGFDVDGEASELVWDMIDGTISEHMDLELMKLVLEFIEEEKLVCYKAGLCSKETLTFDYKDLFLYEDSGELYCILRSSGKEETDRSKVESAAAYLAEIHEAVTASREALLIRAQE